MVDLVNLEENGFNDVVANELEVGVTQMVKHVLFPACEKVINDDHAVTPFHQTVHEVAPHEASPTRHQNPLPFLPFQLHTQWDPSLHRNPFLLILILILKEDSTSWERQLGFQKRVRRKGYG